MSWNPPPRDPRFKLIEEHPRDPRWDIAVNPDGNVEVPVSRSTRRRIDANKRPGETDSDVLARALGKSPGFNVTGAQSASQAFPPGPERDAAIKLEETFRRIPMDRRAGLLAKVAVKLREHNMADEKLRELVMESAAKMRPEQQERLLIALAGKTESKEISETVVEALLEQERDLSAAIGVNRDKHAYLTRKIEAANYLIRIAESPVLQKLTESGFHKALAAWRSKEVILFTDLTTDDVALNESLCTDMLGQGATVFVVQHDWAAAFAKADEFAGGEYRMPYEGVVFEFRISGSRVCCSVSTKDYVPVTSMLHIETPVGWAMAGLFEMQNGQWRSIGKDTKSTAEPIMAIVSQQIRAIAIALEAEVAVSEVVRAPHKLNAKRERAGKLPILDYHVVSLANRRRSLPPDPATQSDERKHASPRLHFRRGHWRHFDNHKTWINWMLVGNPDLGFVDKHYRL